ncbi:hypothetical protein BDP27DRAFT_1330451 [Rhodocollybia butyracea]|uniref:Uncharacterized protein n=1 Tax=Rhodocollybia butyracea TaxID=206335 RepID=A0A9P5U5A7_9AGAR|nr:hypothetical protein BDP27DRAFT_1330451 [Rhodocollybia butyracea]
MSKFMKLKTPSLPSAPKMPTLPSLPTISTPSLPTLPTLPSLPTFPSSDSITTVASETRARLMRSMSSFSNDSEDSEEKEEESAEPPVLEPVYIVLRPLNLTQAPQALLKGVGHIVKDFEFENYLVLQHWGVLIGDRYYHLHIDDATQKISVSMVPFIRLKGHEHHTIKFPIWRTSMGHDERVGIAVGIIKAMGNYSTETEVEITDEEGKPVTSPEDRERYKMDGRYRKTPLNSLSLFKGKYSAVTNNCIHFTRHYVFDQILTRKKELKNFSMNVQWLVTKWRDMGCKRGPIELTKFLAGLLCINPFSMTPQKGARVLIKLLSLFLNIDYNPTLDKKLLSDSASADEALEEVSDATIEEVPEELKDDHAMQAGVAPIQ